MGARDDGRRGGQVAGVAAQSMSAAGGPFPSMAQEALLRSGQFAGLRQVSQRTPDLVLGRFASAQQPTRLDLGPRRQVYIQVDRPTVWRPAVLAQDEIWFRPDNAPTSATWTGANFASGISAADAMPGQGGGSCYLSGPGRWWLFNTSASLTVQGYLIDATDPAVAAQIMNERGTGGEGFTRTLPLVSLTPTLVLPINRQRRAFRFQVITQTGTSGFSWGFSNSNISPPAPTAMFIGVGTLSAGGGFASEIFEVSGDLETQRALWVTQFDPMNNGNVIFYSTLN